MPSRPLTVPPIVNVLIAQVTATLRTSPLPTVPVAFAIVHVCDGLTGCVRTVTCVSAAARLLVVWNVKLAVRRDREIVAAVLLQHQPRRLQAADRAADREARASCK